MERSQKTIIGEHWSNVTRRPRQRATRWWQSPSIVRHQNFRACGELINGSSAGARRVILDFLGGRVLERGISIGCGNGYKEMELIKAGLVHSFDLFELSEARVDIGKKLFEDAGLSDRGTFMVGDAFEESSHEVYDIVYWDSSLHHMMDARAAVSWGFEALKDGGLMVVNDYFGPNRLQWTDRSLEWNNRILSILPKELRAHALDPDTIVFEVSRPDKKSLIAHDPSEAADSESILPALRAAFPQGEMLWLGGAIYNIGLADIICNFNELQAHTELQMCLAIDDLLSEMGENHFGLFIALKGPATRPVRSMSPGRLPDLSVLLRRRPDAACTRFCASPTSWSVISSSAREAGFTSAAMSTT